MPNDQTNLCLYYSNGNSDHPCSKLQGHAGEHAFDLCWHTDGRVMCCLLKGHVGSHFSGEIDRREHERRFKGGGASSKIPRYDLIPLSALSRISNRFEVGLITHKEKSWNARAENQLPLEDKEWLIERACHAIDHALKYIAKATGQIPDDGDDDVAAIAWAGICLTAASEREKEKAKEKA